MCLTTEHGLFINLREMREAKKNNQTKEYKAEERRKVNRDERTAEMQLMKQKLQKKSDVRALFLRAALKRACKITIIFLPCTLIMINCF